MLMPNCAIYWFHPDQQRILEVGILEIDNGAPQKIIA